MAKTCKECGGEFKSRQYNAEFCGSPCRRTFNNRRAQRGAVLYDLLMITRHDPTNAERYGLGDRIDALVATFRQEDEASGRKRTWKRANEVHYDTVKVTALTAVD